MKFTKREYINGLQHDLKFFLEAFEEKKTLTWWHGVQYPIWEIGKFKREIEEELAKIASDKNYRPWND